MMLVFVHFFVSVDFLMVHVPGWIDSLYPVTHAHNALQAGVATMMLTMFFLRQFGGYKDYIGLDQFWGLGKLLLALSLLWFWFWFSSFNVLWYGKKPSEQAVIELLIKGPYLTIFLLAFLFVFIVPWFTMIWNPLRRSIWGPTIIAVSVLVGTMMDRIRMYVASWSVEGIGNVAVPKDVLHIDNLPKAVMPQLWDVLLIVGFIAGGVLIYMLATRIIPAVNIWEQKEMLLYKAEVQYHRAKLLVMGKPR
jgi:molybdopterin-containing oxidoreductase family membrane subunit